MLPVLWQVPPGRVVDAVGALESSEFLRQSHKIATAWGAQEMKTRDEKIPGTNHFTVIDPLPRQQRDDVAGPRDGAAVAAMPL